MKLQICDIHIKEKLWQPKVVKHITYHKVKFHIKIIKKETEHHDIVQNVLFCIVMEEYNPTQCQDEVQDDENDVSDSPESLKTAQFLYLSFDGCKQGQIGPLNQKWICFAKVICMEMSISSGGSDCALCIKWDEL